MISCQSIDKHVHTIIVQHLGQERFYRLHARQLCTYLANETFHGRNVLESAIACACVHDCRGVAVTAAVAHFNYHSFVRLKWKIRDQQTFIRDLLFQTKVSFNAVFVQYCMLCCVQCILYTYYIHPIFHC